MEVKILAEGADGMDGTLELGASMCRPKWLGICAARVLGFEIGERNVFTKNI